MRWLWVNNAGIKRGLLRKQMDDLLEQQPLFIYRTGYGDGK